MRISDWSSDVCSSDLQASITAARPASVIRSATTSMTVTPAFLLISPAVSRKAAASRPLTNTSQPASASAVAQALPSPLQEPQTRALRPAKPNSIDYLLRYLAGRAEISEGHRLTHELGRTGRARGGEGCVR